MIGDIARLTALMGSQHENLKAARTSEKDARTAFVLARGYRKGLEEGLAKSDAEFANLIMAKVRPADDADSEFLTAFKARADLFDALLEGEFFNAMLNGGDQ